MSLTAQGALCFDVEEEPEALPDGLIRVHADTTLVELPVREAHRRYFVEFAPDPYLCICFGSTVGHPASRWEHPKIAARCARILEFKRYLPGGGKYWTAKAGVNVFLVFRKQDLLLKPDATYSFPELVIAGERIQLSTSGGGSGVREGWTDWIPRCVSACANHPVRTLNRIAEAALSIDEAKATGITMDARTLPEDRFERYRELSGMADVRAQLTEGKPFMLASGYSYGYDRSKGPFVIRGRRKKHWTFWVDEDRRGVSEVQAKMINWVETARLNGIELPDPGAGQFNHLGELSPERY